MGTDDRTHCTYTSSSVCNVYYAHPHSPTPRLFDLYMYMNRLMVQANQQAKLFYHTGDLESLIGWVRHTQQYI